MLKVALGATVPESQTWVSLLVVWSTGSELVHVIDWPAEIVIVAGTKADLSMLTATAWPAVAAAMGAGAC
jgi:hypothetical protein